MAPLNRLLNRRDLLIGSFSFSLLGCVMNKIESTHRYGLSGKNVAQPGKGQELADVLLEASRGVAKAKGCRVYLVHISPAEPDAVWVTEVWDSKADHAASLSLPETQALIKVGRPLIAGFSDRLETTVLGGHGLDW
jgi:quinol monooxygenase YgiN